MKPCRVPQATVVFFSVLFSVIAASAQTLHFALIDAAKNGDTRGVAKWLDGGLEANLSDENGWTALMHAASNGHLKTVQLLLERGALPDIRNAHGVGAFDIALSQGRIDVAKLLKRFSDEAGTVGQFLAAARNGDLETVQRLATGGVDVNAAGRDGKTALFHAAWDGHTDVTRALLNAGATVETAQEALLYAAQRGHDNAVKTLAQAGVDVNVKDSEEWTPLMLAARFGHASTVKVLLETGIGTDSREAEAAFGWAAMMDHHNVVLFLGQAGVDVNAITILNRTPLHHAVIRRHMNTIRVLLELGADVDAEGRIGVSPLEQAERTGLDDIARLLREARTRH